VTLFTPEERRRFQPSGSDPVLFVAMLLLIGLGITMIYSATAQQLLAAGVDPYTAMRKQAIWAVIAVILFLAFSIVDYRELEHFAGGIYIATVLAILATYFFPEVNGATRWILVGGQSLQPSEFAKPAMAVVLAASLRRRRDEEETTLTWKKIVRALLLLVLPVLLIVRQPDLGTSLVYFFLAGLMIYAAGATGRQVVGLVGGAVGAGWVLFQVGFLKAYQLSRFTCFFDPGTDPQGDCYNQVQSITAIGSGRFSGKGLFNGYLTQLNYVPEQESDFIFTAIGEQLGFLGAVVILAVYAVILWRLLAIGITSGDPFATLVLVGIAGGLGFQVFVNVGMTVQLVPITGLPLPLVSAGGSSMLATAISLGIANSIWARRPATRAQQRTELVSGPIDGPG
jgi:rod shape determining protein RodA